MFSKICGKKTERVVEGYAVPISTAPLMSPEGQPEAKHVFAHMCAKASQAFRKSHGSETYQGDDIGDEFDLQVTGGRYVDAEYTGTYFVHGAKWECPKDRRLKMAVSTNTSNRLSEYKHSSPFMNFDVYTSYHSKHQDGGGMNFWPYFNDCGKPSMFADVFDRIPSECLKEGGGMESVLEANGITVFDRFICGFHIHGKAVYQESAGICPLDWYYQPNAQRLDDPNMWEHYVLTDQASPVDFYKSNAVKYLGTYYWPDMKVGCDAVGMNEPAE